MTRLRKLLVKALRTAHDFLAEGEQEEADDGSTPMPTMSEIGKAMRAAGEEANRPRPKVTETARMPLRGSARERASAARRERTTR